MATPSPETPKQPLDTAAIATLAAAGTALATGVTGLAVTGTIGRVQRNHPTTFAVALGLTIGAAACLTIAGTVASRRRKPDVSTGRAVVSAWDWTSKAWLLVGIALATAGVITGFAVSITTAGDTERPRISVTLDAATLTMTGSATVKHLSSNDPLIVTVDGLKLKDGLLTISRRLAEASIGPDSDGNAGQRISVHVPPGAYDAVGVRATIKDSDKTADACGTYPSAVAVAPADDKVGEVIATDDNGQQVTSVAKRPKSGTACYYVALPAPERPRLSVRWAGIGHRTLLVGAVAPNAAQGKTMTGLLHVDVMGRVGKRMVTLLRVVREPSGPGEIVHAQRIAVPAAVESVCATARVIARGSVTVRPRCPLHVGDGGTLLEMRGPAALVVKAPKHAKKKTST
jgi:hypothetical protein